MAKAKSAEEAGIPAMKAEQASGSPERSQPSVASTLPEGMSRPSAEGEANMGGVHKGADSHMGNSGMSAAVSHLKGETERSSMPSVGGYDASQHSGKMNR